MIDVKFLKDKVFVFFCLKFLAAFLIFYLGTKAVIGLSAPSGFYSPFVAKYLDYVSGLKNLIISSVKFLLSIFGIKAAAGPEFRVGIVGGKSVIVAMDCVGFMVYSVWLAYIIASESSTKLKWLWSIGGLLILFLINCIRIAAFLYAHNKGSSLPLGLDHHTWFNLLAYSAIFLMIFLYEYRQSIHAKRLGEK